MTSINILLSLIILLTFFIISLLFLPSTNSILIKQVALIYSFIIFILSLLLWIFYNNELGNFVLVIYLPWLSVFNIYYSLGIDGISIFFILLTTFLIPICLLVSWESIKYKVKEFVIMLLLTELLLINVFATLDLFFFYVFF